MRNARGRRDVNIVVAVFEGEIYAQVSAAAADAGLIPIETHAALSAHPREETTQPDGHPTRLGHWIIAEAIRDALGKQKLLPVSE